MATLTVYPDPNPETTSCDGYVYRDNGGSEIWGTIRGGAGTTADATGGGIFLGFFDSTATTDEWDLLGRGIFLFDTSALPDDATVSSAVLSVKTQSKQDNNSATPAIALVSSTPASNTDVATGDYANFGTTRYADTDITYANFSVGAYSDFTLNATGIAAISKTGISKFGTRTDKDLDNSVPNWASSSRTEIICDSAETAGTTSDPRLVITYPSGFIPKIIMY